MDFQRLGDFLRRQNGEDPLRIKTETTLDVEIINCPSKSKKQPTILTRLKPPTNVMEFLKKKQNDRNKMLGRNDDNEWFVVQLDDEEDDNESNFELITNETITYNEFCISEKFINLQNQMNLLKLRLDAVEQNNNHRNQSKNFYSQLNNQLRINKTNKCRIKNFHSVKVKKNGEPSYVIVKPTVPLGFDQELASKVKSPNLKQVKHILNNRKTIDPHEEAISKIISEINGTKSKLKKTQTKVKTIYVF